MTTLILFIQELWKRYSRKPLFQAALGGLLFAALLVIGLWLSEHV